ncbi:MAG: DUF4147 domain-containing protein [Paracoccaceae bacterium]
MLRRGMDEDLETLRAEALRLFRAGLEAVDPGVALRRYLAQNRLPAPGPGGRRLIAAAGRAAPAMADEATDALGPCETLVVTDHGGSAPFAGARLLPAGFPEPDVAGMRATQAVLHALGRLGPEDRAVVLLSGGAGTMLTLPVDGVSLADKAAALRLMREAGAGLREHTLVAQHLSQAKGGGLLGAAAPARLTALILADAAGDDARMFAGGPVSPPLGSRATARAVIELHGMWDRMPASVRAHLSRPAPPLPASGRADRIVVGSNLQAVTAIAAEGARAHARPIAGDVEEVVHDLLAAISNARPGEAVVFGGRVVTLRRAALPDDESEEAEDGPGPDLRNGHAEEGRLHRLALRFAEHARDRRLPGDWVLLVAATDGGDGNGTTAGAVVDSGLIGRIASGGVAWRDAIRRGDPQDLLRVGGALCEIGPTGADVGDLAIFIRR